MPSDARLWLVRTAVHLPVKGVDLVHFWSSFGIRREPADAQLTRGDIRVSMLQGRPALSAGSADQCHRTVITRAHGGASACEARASGAFEELFQDPQRVGERAALSQRYRMFGGRCDQCHQLPIARARLGSPARAHCAWIRFGGLCRDPKRAKRCTAPSSRYRRRRLSMRSGINRAAEGQFFAGKIGKNHFRV